ncbi:MAG TPA: lysozyme inhibitor LprI family protein [Xanthobacteraceae bacterium]
MRPLWTGLVLLLALTAAQAQPNSAAKPGPDETAAVQACIDDAVRNKTGLPACVGKAVALCLERQLQDTVFDCQIRELAIWDRILNERYGEITRGIDKKTAARLREVQRAWIAYVDKNCMMSYVLMNSGSTGAIKWEYACRLGATSQRVAELWGLRDWLAERDRLSSTAAKP